MKITKYMGAFAVIAMLAACSTDDELAANSAANEVKITANVGGNSIFTRSNPLGTEEEQQNFNENDVICVTTEGKTGIYKKTGEVWAPANAGDYLVWTGNAQAFEPQPQCGRWSGWRWGRRFPRSTPGWRARLCANSPAR